jgi:oligoribonuclease NrnB/cAMP/cGMP phosphodiesterase (DHH superfamily)
MRVKLFTHTDLDGCGAAVVANQAFGKENVDVTYCDYSNVDDKIANFITSGNVVNYDLIFITDISVKERVAEMLDRVNTFSPKVVLLDHHNSAIWLNKYEWATVTSVKLVETMVPADGGYSIPDGYEEKTAGTSMFYDYVNDRYPLHAINIPLESFVEEVRRYDTWDWFNLYNDEHAKALNDLLYLIGREKFVNRFSDNPDIAFTDTERLILEIEQNKIRKYIDRVSNTVVVRPLQGASFHFDNVGFVFAEQYTSELGNVIANNRPELDFVVIVNLSDCALGFRGVKDHIDLGTEVAVHFGGGGHPKSAGAKLDKDSLRNILLQSMFTDINLIRRAI